MRRGLLLPHRADDVRPLRLPGERRSCSHPTTPPAEEFALASQLGATINLDDITHIDFEKDTIGSIPKRISCRYNPGGTFTLGESEEGFQVMDNPGTPSTA